MIGRAGADDRPPHPATTIDANNTMAAPARLAVNTAISPPSALCAPMSISIGHHCRHDDAALDDGLNIGVEADECEPARHDAEDERANHGAGDPADASGQARAADNRRR